MRNRLVSAEIAISYVLRVGIILCAAVIGLGILLSFLNPEALGRFSRETLPALSRGDIVPEAAMPRTPAQFGEGLLKLDPTTVIAFGLVLLIALPVVRVALTVVLFLIERDYVYLFITLFVLIALLSSLVLGKHL